MRKISNNNSWVGAPTDLFTPLGRFYSQSSVHLTLNLQGCSYGNSALEYMVNFGYSGTPRVYFMGPSSYGTAPLGLDSEVNFYYETINTTSYYLGFTVSGGCNDSSRTVATIASVNGDVAFDSKDAVQSNYTLLNTYRYLYNGYEGNVGIGTIAPGYKLTVNGGTGDVLNVAGGQINGLNSTPTSADQAVPLGYLQSNYSTAAASAASTLWNGTLNGNIYNGTTGAGNVGIGTTGPTARLDVNSGIPGNSLNMEGGQIYGLNSTPVNADQAVPLGYLQNNYAPTGTAAGSAFVQGGNSFGAAATLGTIDNNLLNINTNNAIRMTVAAAGNVGIGTTAPGAKLDVRGSIGFGINGTSPVGYLNNIGTSAALLSAGGNPLLMYVNGTEIMRIGYTSVGIGTTALGTKLTVNAGTGNAVDVSGGRIVGLNTTPVNANEAVPLTYLQSNYSTAAASAASTLWNGTLNGNIYNGTAGAGNVGIGTTGPR